jgi:hypothetical protein
MVVPSRNPACVGFRNGTVLLVLLHHLLEDSKNHPQEKTNTGNPLITVWR